MSNVLRCRPFDMILPRCVFLDTLFWHDSCIRHSRRLRRRDVVYSKDTRRQPDYPETALCHVPQLERAPALPKAMDPYHTVPSPSTVHVQSKARQPQAAANFLLSSSHCFVVASTSPKRDEFRNFPPTIPLVNPGYLRFRFHLP
jgi:hypothetical protein